MTLPDHFEFICPARTASGLKALEHLPGDLGALNARKPLIITDKRSTESGLVKQIAKAFRTSGSTLGVYDGAAPGAGMDTLRELYNLYLDRGFDAILALGGGAAVDLAKVVNIAVSGRPEDLARCQGVDGLDGPLNPFAFIPAAAGTARECAGEVVFGDLYFNSRYLVPDLVTIDPRMITDEDPLQLVFTAVAALTCAAEAYAGARGNPFVESYAQLVIDFVFDHLLDQVRQAMAEKGRTARLTEAFSLKKGRLALVNAACMAGYVYANTPPGLAARLGQAIGQRSALNPALAMGIVLPCVLEDGVQRQGRDLSRILRPMIGLESFSATPAPQRFAAAMAKIRHLFNALFLLTEAAVPRTLEDAGLTRDALAAVAEAVAASDPDPDSHQVCRTILEHAFTGQPVAP
ncbi:MAG: iron-containing alcohol dehydrogenase [Desulfobacteraceae bacterium]|jgi:alcohol dehydrogenase|nr:iron-containing alcohol dehydrogenase [Desulfobacteraceae bacterium]